MLRGLAFLLSAACAALAVWLGWNHPLSPALALLGIIITAVLAYTRARWWPLWLLPALPLIGLMPWSGWLVVEELDLVVLALAAGGWLRLAAGTARHEPPGREVTRPSVAWLWGLPLLVCTGIALMRGFADAGGLSWGWWQGYREPLNSLRLAKPALAVALLWPLWRDGLRPPADRAWMDAMLLLLLGVALAVVSERLAFTGLLNFSSDYRVTAPFWEMHVGGAALDAVLVISLPFAVAALASARTHWRWFGVATVLALGAYAALATFSRIVYLAVPISVGVWAVLRARQAGTNGGPARSTGALGVALVGLLVYGLLAAWNFGSSGYRGQLALASATALLLPLPSVLRGMHVSHWWRGALLGLGAMLLVGAASWWVPKGAYFSFALCWLVGAMSLGLALKSPPAARGRPAEWALAGFLGVTAGVIAVAVNWAGPQALSASAAAAFLLLALLGLTAVRDQPVWPSAWRWQGQLMAVMVLISAVVGVFVGGAYMGKRLENTAQDSEDRRGHWSRALALLDGSDWVFGKGLGRYPANQALTGQLLDQTGDYRLMPEKLGQDTPTLVLTSGKHLLGYGEVFRVSQRIALPAPGPLTLGLRVQTDQPVSLALEVCEKYLLYTENCLSVQHRLEPTGGGWRELQLRLTGKGLSQGSWYASRPITFSISMDSRGSRIEIDSVSLVDSENRPLLQNGNFERGLARWFATSDKHHMPWHAKNLAVHQVFESGLAGLGAFVLFVGAALWRASFGTAKGHVMAPPLVAALVALLVVGMVDSLLDMPRVAFLALLLPTLALALPGDGESKGRPKRRRYRRDDFREAGP